MSSQVSKRQLSPFIFFTIMAVVSLALLSLTTKAAAQGAVTITDIDNAPDQVAENSPAGSTVGVTIQASGATTYTIDAENVRDGFFAVDPQSGVVTVARAILDHETLGVYFMQIKPSTGQEATFFISIIDVPEPVSPIADTDFNPNKIIYGSTPGAPVGITARAVDPDEGSAVAYSLSGGSTDLFTIGRQDGVVTLASDSYKPDQDYLIEVTAESSDETFSTKQFTVRADEPIRIASSLAASTVREGEELTITFSFAKTDLELKAVSAGGSHSCGITSGHEAVCWGDDGRKQSTPPAGGRFIAVSAGGSHSCGITPDNDAVCWGDNESGQTTPTAGGKFIAIGAGSRHTCAITTDKRAVCWGTNTHGSTMPNSDQGFTAISSGGSHSCGITKAGARCWGSGFYGQSSSSESIRISAVSAGLSHSCAITLDNWAVCWGDDASGQSSPPSDRKFIAVSAGSRHTCAITIDNGAVCWGDDASGQSSPPSDRKFIAVSAGSRHTCAITIDNGAVCWGSNRGTMPGEFFNQSAPPRLAPTASRPITITATLINADMEQIGFSGNGQAVIPAGSTQTILTVTAEDDNAIEPETRYAISFSVEGNAAFERDELIITVPVDQDDTQIRDTDNTDNQAAESSSAGVPVGITAYAGNSASYTLSDNAGGRFAISATGLVTVADGGLLDFEDATTHSITVQAALGGSSMATSAFTISVSNVNEITLRDRDSNNNLAHASTGAVALGMTLEAVHADAAPITAWQLQQDSLFELTQADNSSTQGLRIKADAENLSSLIKATTEISVIVRTEYDVTTESFIIRFTEQEPVLVGELIDTDGASGGEVAENSPAGSTVGITIQAAAAATYTLTDSAGGRFAINSSGLVTVANGSLLDFEDAATHSITVEASNINDRRSMRFIIDIADVNEFDLMPVTDSDNADNELPENATAGSRTGITLSATDADGSAVVTYMLSGSNNRLFLADTNTGIVTLQGQLNYELSTRRAIIAQAMSSDGSDPTTAAFTIAVINVHEIALADTDPTSNTVLAAANATVEGLTLAAIHADGAAITSWEITTQTNASTLVDLFEFSEPQASAAQTLRIKEDADLTSIATPATITLSISVHTAYDEAGKDFDVDVFSATGIRLRVRVYLEGALE